MHLDHSYIDIVPPSSSKNRRGKQVVGEEEDDDKVEGWQLHVCDTRKMYICNFKFVYQMHSVNKEETVILSIASPNIDQFSKIFHQWTRQWIFPPDTPDLS